MLCKASLGNAFSGIRRILLSLRVSISSFGIPSKEFSVMHFIWLFASISRRRLGSLKAWGAIPGKRLFDRSKNSRWTSFDRSGTFERSLSWRSRFRVEIGIFSTSTVFNFLEAQSTQESLGTQLQPRGQVEIERHCTWLAAPGSHLNNWEGKSRIAKFPIFAGREQRGEANEIEFWSKFGFKSALKII